MKLEALNDINNQCTIVQRKIAQCFGSHEIQDLINELQTCELKVLQKSMLLKRFSGQIKN